MGNVGRWDTWNAGGPPAPYADTETYRRAAEWLAPCVTVEDWGCGRGWFSTLRQDAVGIDGSGGHADVRADLTTYRSAVEGILLRHVIEHDYRWKEILDNAVASFTRRLCLVLFTPLAEETKEIAWTGDIGVPDISFAAGDIAARLDGCWWEYETIPTGSQYGAETIWRVEKP